MADQTITCSGDSYLDEASGTGDTIQGALDRLNFGRSSGDDFNPVWTFDVSSLTGKMWDSVTLTLTYFGTSGDSASPASFIYLSHIEKAMNTATCTFNDFDTSAAWATSGAETSADNNHSTRVQWILSVGPHAVDDIDVSPDITEIVKRALSTNAGTLHLILYATAGVGGAVHTFDSLQTSPGGVAGFLTFTNVEDMETTTSSNPSGTAANVAVPSASSLSKSGRPPIAGADRQNSVTILHDGVEPFNMLSVTLRGAFGADN